ncbi:MAG: Dabb family protein [Candidatus Hydrogenedentota bacterium]
MLIHNVLFWLRDDLTNDERAAFHAGVETLASIHAAHAVYIGTPAATPKRPVIDDSYDVALTVLLDTLEAHDTYQDDPIHRRFVKECASCWTKVAIIDAD